MRQAAHRESARPAHRIAATTVALMLAVLAGCNEELPKTLKPGQAVTVQGEIESGAECPTLVAKDRRFSLAGGLGKFEVGDRVCVRGRIAENSFCMSGEATIAITTISAENDCR